MLNLLTLICCDLHEDTIDQQAARPLSPIQTITSHDWHFIRTLLHSFLFQEQFQVLRVNQDFVNLHINNIDFVV